MPPERRFARASWRASIALLLSMLIHALLLSLTFGEGLGLPGLDFPWKTRRFQADDLRVRLALAPVIAHAGPAVSPVASTPIEPTVTAHLEIDAAGKSLFATEAAAMESSPAAPASASIMTALAPSEASVVVAPSNSSVRQPDIATLQSAPSAEVDLVAARVAELARLEQEKQAAQQAARRQAELIEATRLDAVRQERARQEIRRTEQDARDEAARQEVIRQDAARQESARLEQAQRERLQQEKTQQALALERERIEAIRQDAARQEALRQERMRQEQAQVQAQAARQAVLQETARQAQLARQEAERAEAARLEIARQETARQEQAREERLKQEKSQQAALAEQEAAREARLRAIGRQLDEEAAKRNAALNANSTLPRLLPTSSSLRRGRLFGRSDPNADLVLYAEAWSRKIQMNTAADTVREVAKQPHTHPLVTVAIRSDGSVEKVSFVTSSGVPAIDEAIRQIAQTQAPYPAFSPGLAREYDVIEIRRSWIFDTAIRLE